MSATSPRGPIAWFVHNHVAANLLMLFVLAAGGIALWTIRQEVFPEVELDTIAVTVPYPGASPEEVEEGICTRIEEQVASVDGIKSVTSTAAEGAGTVLLELERGVDPAQVLRDVESEVDRITTFPEEAEEPVVTELTNRRQVIDLVLYGDVPERTLKVLAERVRSDLTALAELSQVDVVGARDYEISIEVSEKTLRRYGLTLAQVADAVRRSSLDLPAGTLKTRGGEILVRAKGQRYTGREFESVVVRAWPDGTRLRLADIATIRDGFDEDAERINRFDGKPAVLLQVFRVGEQDAIHVADGVKAYIAEHRDRLPAGVDLALWRDRTDILKARRDLLLRNARIGLVLVFGSLLLFLAPRLAFWVTMGIPVSFLGALALLPQFGVTVNMISLFAFILALGIVVDDAIVVGEGIYGHLEEGKPGPEAAVAGAREMAVPVTFSVLTTIAAFVPLLFVEGTMGKFMKVIPVVVIAAFCLSLLESLFILPAHLSSVPPPTGRAGPLERLRRGFGRALMAFVRGPYAWMLRKAVAWRYLTAALFAAVFLVSLGWVASGRIKFVFFPKVESDTVTASLTMPQGTSLAETAAAAARIEAAARQVQEEFSDNGRALVRHVYSLVGGRPAGGGPQGAGASGTHLATVRLQLLPSEERSVPSARVAARWRELVGPVPGVESLTFTSSLFSAGEPIVVRLSGDRFDTLETAAARVKEALGTYPGVTDIRDSFQEGKLEMRLRLQPAARGLGLTLSDLARQVRGALYGDEALRIQRGRDEVKVMVRFPEEERRSLGSIETMRVRTPGGAEVPFSEVAQVVLTRGYATISREERKRVVNVIADVDEEVANAREVLADLASRHLPGILADYPELSYSFEGQEKSRRESLESLWRGFAVALLAIYTLLAIPFRSYVQPFIVMSAIPFGIVGAVWGHVLLGMPLTILSLFGIVAVAGVVVNDALVLIDYVNRARAAGRSARHAVVEAGVRRFRPILLTTVTTFFGLMPMILEKSMQAQFLIPMAVSLAFGVAVSTAITLVLVPSLYLVVEDLVGLVSPRRAAAPEPSRAVAPAPEAPSRQAAVSN
ncbi:MAG: efflux RND transporter permease subunit [Deferrisomatales bacterium]